MHRRPGLKEAGRSSAAFRGRTEGKRAAAPPLRAAALRGGAVVVVLLACCAPLAGCAAPGADGEAATARRQGFEGWYRGRQIPLSINAAACRGRAREIWFEVENGAIELRNARQRRMPRKRSLLGTVSADGVVAMLPNGGGRTVAGRIEGGRLAAATVQGAQDIQAVQAGGKVPCGFRYEATRTAAPSAGAAPPAGLPHQP